MGQYKSAKWPNRNPQNGPMKIHHVDSLNITQIQDIKQREIYDFLYKYELGPPLSPFGKPGLPHSSPQPLEREREREREEEEEKD